MACNCGSKATTAASGPAADVEYEARPYRSDIQARTFAERSDAEMYLATNGGGTTRTVAKASPAALPNA